MTISIESARAFLKADGDDDDLIIEQIAQAQSICEGYCNRKFYDDQQSMMDDFSLALTDRTDQALARTNALAAVTGTDDDSIATRALITGHYTQVMARISQRTHGIVVDGSIRAAIMLTLGHLYINREDNLSTGNNVVQVPVGAQRVLQPYLWIGDLADNPSGYVGCTPVEGS